MSDATVHQGDVLDVLRGMPDNSFDACVCDPPYGLRLMGHRWDYDVPSAEVWREVLRVLKPGGHLLAFAGTRTQHRMACAIEDGGFELRDMIAWMYGSGYPKNLDVGKAIDKVNGEAGRLLRFTAWMRSTGLSAKAINEATGTFMASHYLTDKTQPAIPTPDLWAKLRPLCGDVPEWVDQLVERIAAEREVLGRREMRDTQEVRIAGAAAACGYDATARREVPITAPATPEAQRWHGYGTALKPSIETITVATKPHTGQWYRDKIVSSLIELEARLWLLSFASAAEGISTSSQSGFAEACAIARWTAEEVTNTRDDLCAEMDTSLFESATTTSLSIVSSWRRTLTEGWSDGSTCTIGTGSSTIIDLKTLRFSLSLITPESIIRACSHPGGFHANAATAESHFSASLSLLQSIQTLSATGPAISQEQQRLQDEAVRPSLDPCVVARKPLTGTVAENVLRWGTGAINVDGCRVGTESTRRDTGSCGFWGRNAGRILGGSEQGRWPANIIHDGSDEVLAVFPVTGPAKSAAGVRRHGRSGEFMGKEGSLRDGRPEGYDDQGGSAARFFYCAKPGKRERGAGNTHPTVKPLALTTYLARLVLPPAREDGAPRRLLVPFAGSGSEVLGGLAAGWDEVVGIEREPEYVAIAQRRIAARGLTLPGVAVTPAAPAPAVPATVSAPVTPVKRPARAAVPGQLMIEGLA